MGLGCRGLGFKGLGFRVLALIGPMIGLGVQECRVKGWFEKRATVKSTWLMRPRRGLKDNSRKGLGFRALV